MDYKKISLLPLLCTIVFLSGCNQKKGTDETGNGLTSGAVVIDIEKALEEGAPQYLSQFSSEIEYIRLEMADEGLVAGNSRSYVLEDYIYTVAFRQILQFDRKTGKFIKELSHYGNDPEAYQYTLPDTPPTKSNEIYVRTGNRIKTLNSNGEIKTVASGPTEVDHSFEIEEGIFAGYVLNKSCNVKDQLIIFNRKGDIIKSFPNHQQCEPNRTNSISFRIGEGWFFTKSNDVFFKEAFNDTVFQVTKNELLPAVIFNMGEHSPSYEKKEIMEDDDYLNIYSVSNIDLNNNYVFFNIKYQGQRFSAYHNIKENQTHLAYERYAQRSSFQDDLNEFIPFSARYINDQNELVSNVEAEVLYDWFRNNPDKIGSLPKHIQSLQNIDPEDNPVVMIVKLK
mgnify:CR=1 FL=1